MFVESSEIMRIAKALARDTQLSDKEIVVAIYQAEYSISVNSRANRPLPFELYRVRKILRTTARLRGVDA